MFFKNYPLLTIIENNRAVLIRNIMRRVNVLASIKNNDKAYIEYDVKEGEMPEDIADRVYGSPQYHWLIMLMNDIHLIYCDWVKPYDQLVREAKLKYGDSNLYDTHHYIDSLGNIVHPEETPGATPVTNLDYEIAENENKRRIKVLNSVYLPIVDEEIKNILRD